MSFDYKKQSISFYNIQTGTLIKEIVVPEIIAERAEIVQNNTYNSFTDTCILFNNLDFIYQTKGGVIRKYSSITGKLLGSLSVIISESTYCVYTQEGYFNSNVADNFVHVVNGMEVTGLDQLADVYYRPDLVAAKLRGEDISAQDGFVSLNSVIATGDAPIVHFTSTPASTQNRDVTVNFSVQDAGGGIGAVYVSLNGKVIQVQSSTRKFTLEGANSATPQKNTGGKTVQFSHTLSMSARENIIEAYATNEAGVIESRHAQTRIMWQGATAKPNLYVLAVGVNKYRSEKVRQLNFAVADAQSVLDTFESAKGNLYSAVFISSLFDENATKKKIQEAFVTLSAKIKPDDVFVFYVSGHGIAHNGDYYFLPNDFDGAQLETAVSKNFIVENIGNISASKTVIFLDTCNSGAIVNGDSNTAFYRLSRATGQAIIAASSSEQYAREGYSGHGVFTYALLDALSGKADFLNTGNVSLLGIATYVSGMVPTLSKMRWNEAQNPWVDIRKQDFPLVGK